MSVTLPGGLKIEATPEQLRDPEVQKLLAEVMSTLDENPLQKFRPHAKQVAFMASPAKTKVYMGGTRSGKSTAGIVYVVIQLVDDDMIPPHLMPYKRWKAPVKARVIMPDFGATLMSVMETLHKWVPESQLRGGSWEKAWKEKDHQLHFANGGMIDFLTLEQDVNKFGGVTRQIVLYDEEPKGDKGEEIRWNTSMRLAEVNGEELFAYSPIHGLGWTHDEFEEKKGPEKAPQVWEEEKSEDYPNGLIVVRSSIYDNPYLSKEGLEGALAKIPEAVRASYAEGNYTHFKGLVYPEFSAAIHVIDESLIDTDRIKPLAQVDGIDPGQQTTAVLFAGFDQEGRMLIYDEYKASGVSAIPENCAERIFDIRERWGLSPEPKYRMIDPSAWTRELATGKRIDQAWREAGMKVIPAQNEVEPGVFEVMRRLAHKDAEGNPAPLIQISSRCTHLLKEIGKYRLNPKEDGSFGVVKKNDHFCFPAGTLVKTLRGDAPIEKLCLDDLILTREGYFPIRAMEQSSPDEQLYELDTEYGRLRGTGDHPIYCDGEFRRLDSLRYGDIIQMWQRPSNTPESGGDVIPIPNAPPTLATSGLLGTATSIVASGKTPTELPSQMASMSTTLMGTRAITTPPISKPSAQNSISPNIGRLNALPLPRSEWTKSEGKRPSGTGRQKDAHGIAFTVKRFGRAVAHSLRPATSAAIPTRPSRESRIASSAPTTASPKLAERAASMTRPGTASTAEARSSSTGIPVKELAPARVLGVSRAGRSAVFSLQVDGPSEFFADDILVSNCDVMRYIAMTHQIAKERRKTRVATREGGWTPGTAPPFKPRKKISKGLGGKFS